MCTFVRTNVESRGVRVSRLRLHVVPKRSKELQRARALVRRLRPRSAVALPPPLRCVRLAQTPREAPALRVGFPVGLPVVSTGVPRGRVLVDALRAADSPVTRSCKRCERYDEARETRRSPRCSRGAGSGDSGRGFRRFGELEELGGSGVGVERGALAYV